MIDFEELKDRDITTLDSEDEDWGGASLVIKRPTATVASGDTAKGSGQKLREPINRKPRILVLHGRQSNENLVGFQFSQLKNALGGKECEFLFLEGDLVWKYKEGFDNHDADPMSVSLSKGKDFKTWFSHTTDDKRDRIDFFKQGDPGVKVSYEGADNAVSKLTNYIEDGGPIDMIVGVFEGSIVIHMAIAKLIKEGKEIPWRLSVFIGSMPVRDDSLAEPLTKKKVPHPTIHVYGKSDEYYYYCRTAAGRKAPEEYYENSIVLEHLDGHQFPATAPRAKEIFERIAAEMKYQCGLQKLAPKKVMMPPKPTSRILKNLDDMSLRKIRVLCMAGGHACTDIIKFQTTALKMALGKDAAEWTYIEGTKNWSWYEGEPTVSDMEAKIAGNKQLKNWYMDTCHEKDGKKTSRLNKDKQFDPETWVEYHDIPEVIKNLKDYIMKNGPFDVLVCFSQGCIFAHLLMAYWRQDPPAGKEKHPERWHHDRSNADQMPWRLSCFFNGMHVRDKNYFHLFEKKLDHPTIHVFGKDDEYYEYARDGFQNKPQEDYYENPLVLTHEENHMFPTVLPRAKQIYDKVVAEIHRNCGGKLEL